MKIDFIDVPMKIISKYLPFALWCLTTILLTALAVIVLPFVLVYKIIDSIFSKPPVPGLQVYENYPYYIRDLDN